jgi:hypothetical protein
MAAQLWRHALAFTAEVLLDGIAKAGAKARCTAMGRAAMSLDLQARTNPRKALPCSRCCMLASSPHCTVPPARLMAALQHSTAPAETHACRWAVINGALW